MNLVNAYSSDSESDSFSGSDINSDNFDQVSGEILPKVKDSDLHDNKLIPGLIPRQIRFKEQRIQEPEIDEEQLEILRYNELDNIHDGEATPLETDIANIFGLQRQDGQNATKFADTTEGTIKEALNTVRKFKNSDFENVKILPLKRKAEDETKSNSKERKTAKEPVMQEINMTKFYKQNSELIREGKLNINEQIRQNASPKYFSAGNNNLTHIIQFTEKNKTLLKPKSEGTNKEQ